MSRLLSVLMVFTAIGLSGVVHGLWTGRWNVTSGPEQAAARLKAVPMTLGDWDGQEAALDAREQEAADISGYLLRRYINRRTGSMVSLLLVCGRPGPVSVHTPETCYRGAGYELMGDRARHINSSLPDSTFWACRFQKVQTAVPEYLRIVYSWGAGGQWSAPENPRLAFFQHPALYKLYVTRPMGDSAEPLEDDPVVEFLRVLMPQLQKSLFSDS